jgi:predicted ester cyclase
MSAESNAKIVRRFIDEVCNARKLNVADELFSAQHAYRDPSVPAGPGPQGIKEVVGTYQKAYADAHWNLDELIVAGDDRVIVRWTGSGTHSAELMGIPPTGKHVSFTEMGILRVAGRQVVESWYDVDMLGMMGQLGLGGQS